MQLRGKLWDVPKLDIYKFSSYISVDPEGAAQSTTMF